MVKVKRRVDTPDYSDDGGGASALPSPDCKPDVKQGITQRVYIESSDAEGTRVSSVDEHAPSTPSKKGFPKAEETPDKKSPAQKSPKKKSKNESPSAADAKEVKSRPWTAAEDSIYHRDMLRNYKPDWDTLVKELGEVAQTQGQPPRSRKAIQLHYERHIKAPLVNKVKASEKGED